MIREKASQGRRARWRKWCSVVVPPARPARILASKPSDDTRPVHPIPGQWPAGLRARSTVWGPILAGWARSGAHARASLAGAGPDWLGPSGRGPARPAAAASCPADGLAPDWRLAARASHPGSSWARSTRGRTGPMGTDPTPGPDRLPGPYVRATTSLHGRTNHQ